jgi:hypothetical protein
MAGTAFGFGSPISYPTSPIQFGLSPYGVQTSSSNYPSAFSQPYGQPLQQILHVLHSVPQQLQQLQQLQYVQQQQLQQVQQLLQIVPAQLAQLQQLVQLVPHQIQQMQQPSQLQQPFGQSAGLSGFGVTSPWAISTQGFGQTGNVM